MNDYETFASVGISKKKKYYQDRVEVEVTFDGYAPPNEVGDFKTFEFEDKFKCRGNLQTRLGYIIKEKYLNLKEKSIIRVK